MDRIYDQNEMVSRHAAPCYAHFKEKLSDNITAVLFIIVYSNEAGIVTQLPRKKKQCNSPPCTYCKRLCCCEGPPTLATSALHALDLQFCAQGKCYITDAHYVNQNVRESRRWLMFILATVPLPTKATYPLCG